MYTDAYEVGVQDMKALRFIETKNPLSFHTESISLQEEMCCFEEREEGHIHRFPFEVSKSTIYF